MNTAATKHFFTILSSKFEIERQRLYQLVHRAEACYSIKDAQGQQELGTILQSYSYPFNIIGEYYEAFYLNHIGRVPEAREKLARVITIAPTHYQAKGILTLSGLEEMRGNFDESMRLRLEALKFHKSSLIVESEFGIAVLLGRQGDHQHAIKLLETFLPALRLFKGTPLYFDYLNSYAVELTEVGRIYEASNVIKLVVNSPYVSHFQNWRETSNEIEQKGYRLRSAVPVSLEPEPKPDNVVHLPEPKPSAAPVSGPAPVLSYMEWKNKMVKEQNNPDENVDELERSDLIVRLLEWTTKDDVDDEKLRKVLKYTMKVMTSK